MVRRLFARRPSHATVVAYLALFSALGLGSAWAANELQKNDVTSKIIKNGGVKGKDLANEAVGSSKVADGSLLGEDFAEGQLLRGEPGPEGPPGTQGLQGDQGAAGSARAYARVSSAGVISRAKNVAGVSIPTTGSYCVTLSGGIDPGAAVLITAPDANGSGTASSASQEDFSVVEWDSSGDDCVGPGELEVDTYLYNGDPIDNTEPPLNPPGDNLIPDAESFTLMVPQGGAAAIEEAGRDRLSGMAFWLHHNQIDRVWGLPQARRQPRGLAADARKWMRCTVADLR